MKSSFSRQEVAGTTESDSVERARYDGLRMTADDFFALPEDCDRYELIDGVAVMSPSPDARHQRIALVVLNQVFNYVEGRRLGHVLHETDILIGRRPDGRELVYRPEMLFIKSGRMPRLEERVRVVPDVVVEVVSPQSRTLDTGKKREDYERAGVGEYWLIDPEGGTFTFYRLSEGRYTVVAPQGDCFESQAITGFHLDLARIRKEFEAFE